MSEAKRAQKYPQILRGLRTEVRLKSLDIDALQNQHPPKIRA